MPGLVRHDYAQLDYAPQQDDPLLTGPPSPTMLPPLSPSAPGPGHVRFIPSQMDPLSATTTQAARESPFRLFIKDARVLFTMLQWLPWVFIPFRTSNPNGELYPSLANLRSMVLQGVLLGCETIFLCLALPIYLTMPGALSILLAACCCLIILGLARLGQGRRFAYSKMDEATKIRAKQYEHERWLFVNGIATGCVLLSSGRYALVNTYSASQVCRKTSIAFQRLSDVPSSAFTTRLMVLLPTS